MGADEEVWRSGLEVQTVPVPEPIAAPIPRSVPEMLAVLLERSNQTAGDQHSIHQLQEHFRAEIERLRGGLNAVANAEKALSVRVSDWQEAYKILSTRVSTIEAWKAYFNGKIAGMALMIGGIVALAAWLIELAVAHLHWG
jgi:hypothetical protein